MSAGFGVGPFELFVLVGIGLTGLLALSMIAASASANRRTRVNDQDDDSSFSASSSIGDSSPLWTAHETHSSPTHHHEMPSGGYDAGLADGGSSDFGGSSDTGGSSSDGGSGGSSD